ncbi:MAG: GntR family transcriptional regulator [Acidobacteria bacterium]|nr:GntR family transcriptional regulator [Acidobacteriota bacterium]
MTAASLPLQNESLAGMAADRIRQAIFDGRFQPGSAIREQLVAKQFGISQNTVREALLELQNLGLVKRLRNRATYVTELSRDDIRKRLAVRIPLEEVACVEAAARLDEHRLDELRAAMEVISAAEQAKSPRSTASPRPCSPS